MNGRILMPVRYSAWLAGDLGKELTMAIVAAIGQEALESSVTNLPRGFLIEFDEAPGVALEKVARAAETFESVVLGMYPVFHHEMGPVWTRTLQVVF